MTYCVWKGINIDEGTVLNEKTKEILKKVNDVKIKFIVSDMVIVEAIWVLKSYYNIDRPTVAKAIKEFLLFDA